MTMTLTRTPCASQRVLSRTKAREKDTDLPVVQTPANPVAPCRAAVNPPIIRGAIRPPALIPDRVAAATPIDIRPASPAAPPIDLQAIGLALADQPKLGALVKMLGAQLNTLAAAIDLQAKANDQLCGKVEELGGTIRDLGTRLKEEEQKATTAATAFHQELAEVRQMAARQNSRIGLLTQQVGDQKTRLDSQERENAVLRMRLAEHDHALARHATQLAGHAEELRNHGERLDAHGLRIAEHGERLETLEYGQGRLERRMTALELRDPGGSSGGRGGDFWSRLPIYAGPGATAAGLGSAGPNGGGCSVRTADRLIPVSGTEDLTGHWTGQYDRLDNGVSVPFILDLVQRESAVVGRGAEPVRINGALADTAEAHVLGQTWADSCDGITHQAVGFSMIYAGRGGMLGPVLHVATRDGGCMVGQWYCPKGGRWVVGGDFRLHRQE